MFKLFLLLPLAFWGDTQVNEWGAVEANYAVGLPLCTHLNLVEFTLGYKYAGVGLSIVESYGFFNGEQLIGSLLPIHITVPLYQRMGFWKGDAYFKQSLEVKLSGSAWAQRYRGVGPLSYLLSRDWEAKAPYIGVEISGRWYPIRMVGIRAALGTLIVKDAPERVYLNIGLTTGTSGPISQRRIAPDLKIVGSVFDDASTGNGNGILEPQEEARIRMLLSNRGLKDSDTIYIKAVLRDTRLAEYLTFGEVPVSPLAAGKSTEISLPLKASPRLPALPLRVRIWGKDLDGNMVIPAYIDIPTSGS